MKKPNTKVIMIKGMTPIEYAQELFKITVEEIKTKPGYEAFNKPTDSTPYLHLLAMDIVAMAMSSTVSTVTNYANQIKPYELCVKFRSDVKKDVKAMTKRFMAAYERNI